MPTWIQGKLPQSGRKVVKMPTLMIVDATEMQKVKCRIDFNEVFVFYTN